MTNSKTQVTDYLQSVGAQPLSSIEINKLAEFSAEPLSLNNSFLGWVFVQFKKILQEKTVWLGLRKFFSREMPYEEQFKYGAFAEDQSRFDTLSNYYGNQYRGSFVLIYLLGAIAVFVALTPIGFYFDNIFEEEQAELYQMVCTWLELFLILAILLIHKVGAAPAHGHGHKFSSFLGIKLNRRWHERWIEYRILAERFRYMEILYPLGLNPAKSGAAVHSDIKDWHSAYFAMRLADVMHAQVDDISSYKKGFMR